MWPYMFTTETHNSVLLIKIKVLVHTSYYQLFGTRHQSPEFLVKKKLLNCMSEILLCGRWRQENLKSKDRLSDTVTPYIYNNHMHAHMQTQAYTQPVNTDELLKSEITISRTLTKMHKIYQLLVNIQNYYIIFV